MSSRIAAEILSRRGIHFCYRVGPSLLPSLDGTIQTHNDVAGIRGSAHWRRGKNRPLPTPALFGNKTCALFSTVAVYDDIDANTGNHNGSPSAPSVEYSSRDGDGAHGSNNDNLTSLRHCQSCTCFKMSEGKPVNAIQSRETPHQLTQSNHPENTLQKDQFQLRLSRESSTPNTDNDGDSREILSNTQQRSCHLSPPLMPPNTPLPPPLPEPKYTFFRRTLPSNLLAFNSPDGKQRFLDALQMNNAEAYFPLSQQFLNQMDPAYCGVSTLVLILNALAMDPNVRWRGGWRWYGDESMLLERCCIEEERVRREGITMEQYCGLARCQGVELVMKRPGGLEGDAENHHEPGGAGDDVDKYDLEDFRRDIINSVQNPPQTHWNDETTGETESQPKDRSVGGYFLVTSFARDALQQTGDGHFSPIAAYHQPSDSCLVLDVARFKYAPYWVSVTELYEAMIPPDKATGISRGWILMYPPTENASEKKRRLSGRPMSKEELEGKRPVACVPLAGSGERMCPVEPIKIDYCSVGKK